MKERSPVISIARQDHLCSALSARLSVPDICGLGTNVKDRLRRAAYLGALAVPEDGFSRGSELPVVPSDTSLFFRASTERLCSVIAEGVIDAGQGSKYQSANADVAILDMAHNIMGVAVGDPREPETLSILRSHYADALATGVAPRDALRSTFVLSCSAPPAVTIGL